MQLARCNLEGVEQPEKQAVSGDRNVSKSSAAAAALDAKDQDLPDQCILFSIVFFSVIVYCVLY